MLLDEFKYSYDRNIESAYIITIKNHNVSENLSRRCAGSCQRVGMPYKIWDAVDGTSREIIIPDHLKDKGYMYWLKQINHDLSPTEVAVWLSHFSLWIHCLEIDKPIMILEHDAVLVDKMLVFNYFNQIVYLGSMPQAARKMPVMSIPPHGTVNDNYHFMLCGSAYAIDPQIARQLVSYAIRLGMVDLVDRFIRADLFPIVQNGLIAYAVEGETTITK
jgi:hypothetical protein